MSLKLSIRVPTVFALAVFTVAAACSPKSDNGATDTTAAATAGDTGAAGAMAGMKHDSAGGMAGMKHDSMSGNMSGMSAMSSMPAEDRPHMRMTGNADQDFLRMMSDHHKGLIAMAHLSAEGDRKGSPAVRADAQKLDKKQDAELDQMVTKLETQFKDKYDPMIMPSNQAMVDQLKPQSGSAYDRTFYQNVVKHHQQAIKMVDEFSPKLQDADLKKMAQRMKDEQQREITEFEQKASKS